MYASVDAGKGGRVVAKYKTWRCREVPLLAMTAALQKLIVEFHPEPTWFRLADENLETKHSQEGIAGTRENSTLERFSAASSGD
jgi:hypothetical protein